MKPLLAVLVLFLGFALAGGLRTESRPRRLPGMSAEIKSPDVDTSDRVTFRLSAPNAKSVLLVRDGEEHSVQMHKDGTGLWSVTTGPLSPDIYAYSFVVDGVTEPDPANPLKEPTYKIGAGQSLAYVPGPSSLSWELNDVPHGIVRHEFYKSRIIGDERDYYVYTPPNYDPNRHEPYPVLYLLHGFSDDASSWVTVGRANVILDNLIAQHKAKPMLVINTLGYGAPEIIDQGIDADPALIRKNTDDFVAALLGEVVPRVEKQYHVSRDASGRAIAGLSMGGAEALSASLNRPSEFGWVGAFSTATTMLDPEFSQAFPYLGPQANSRIRLLWIACGTQDKLLRPNRDFENWLASRGVHFTRIETPGGHSWMVWRRDLTQFAPLLFQTKAK